ncbi:MAG: blue (type 1) copper domain protein [Candidatus Parvarchaeum acidiphilum ARMAN-4]|uniref:Blue (Type 1) copper domain protein n=1 Tax=Candidatus Parvarchaeum acidiphilum ARMAN-4 TaxID=662760 RepID=D2EGL6_PARA4|nr:MAG: blue (type 1) copper domain protein [Candidatus Parvarchaeum acidiphilum ARMAN-4]
MQKRIRSRTRAGNQNTLIYILIIVAALLAVIAIEFAISLAGNSGYGSIFADMMGGNGGMVDGFGTTGIASMMVEIMGQAGTPVAVLTAIQGMKTTPPYAVVFPKNDSIAFESKNVSIVVLAMGVDRAVDLTNSTPSAYITSDTFVIDGLIAPTLVLQKGSTVHITFVNLDSSEYHNVIITSTGPPYQYMPMSAMGGLVSMMPFVQHADYQQGQAYEYSYNASLNSDGTFWYLCIYPGHAQMGMYGKIIVT